MRKKRKGPQFSRISITICSSSLERLDQYSKIEDISRSEAAEIAILDHLRRKKAEKDMESINENR